MIGEGLQDEILFKCGQCWQYPVKLIPMDLSLITGWLKPFVGKALDWVCAQKNREREYDVENFKKLNAIVDEPRLNHILNCSIYTSWLSLEEIDVIQDLKNSLVRIENEFLDSQLKKNAQKLADDMDELLNIVVLNFFQQGEKLQFRPNQLDSNSFRLEKQELDQRIDKAWESYKTFRRSVKDKLKI